MTDSVSRSIARETPTPRRTPLQSRPYLSLPHALHQSPLQNGSTPHMIQ
jgi:hypothetical protein